MFLSTFTVAKWIECLDRFAVLWILCIDIPESGFAVLRSLLHLNNVCVSTREWLYCILDIVHILEQTAWLCKLHEYLYTDICCV